MSNSSHRLSEFTSTSPAPKTPITYDDFKKKYGFIPSVSDTEKIKTKVKSECTCSLVRVVSFFMSFFPIISWMSEYKCSLLIPDLIGGFTVAILHIPQGMAYGVLAGVNAENGLYLAIFPVFIYFLMGTSKHASIGTFSVISMMISSTVGNFRSSELKHFDLNDTVANGALTTSPTNLEIVTSLALTVGLLQLFMAFTQLGRLSVLLSDQLVSGFCTGAIFHVASALLPEILGITIRRFHGPLKLFYVVLGTAFSYIFDFHNAYGMRVVGHIPTGLPAPISPRVDLILPLLSDSFAIAVVVFAISLSMAKIFAKKHNYKIKANQELIALGCANMFSSFFLCFPCSAALARSTVQERSGAKTQMTSLVSCCLMILVTAVLSNLFSTLPRCILSAVILVSSKSIFMQVTEVCKAWNISIFDAMIWLVTMLSTVILDVTFGLLAGITFTIATVIFRSAFPSFTSLGTTDEINLYLDVMRFAKAKELEGIKIYRLEASLNFLNRDAFKKFLQKNVPRVTDECEPTMAERRIQHIILDCSSFSYVDMPGLETLVEITKYYSAAGISVFLTNCSVAVQDTLKHQTVFDGTLAIFPTTCDAIQFCKE